MSGVSGVHLQACGDDSCPGCYPVPPKRSKPKPGESVDARRTRENREMLERGVHPATRVRLLVSSEPRTCGGCSHHHAYDYHNGRFHKCDLHRLGESHSAASDVRVSWPACLHFEADR